jgi:hypothetical protein
MIPKILIIKMSVVIIFGVGLLCYVTFKSDIKTATIRMCNICNKIMVE